MDPQQRLALELTREALQDAGAERRPFQRERSAVFLGASVSEFSGFTITKVRSRQIKNGEFGPAPDEDLLSELPDINAYTLSGGMINVIASNVAHSFKLGGPALTSDAACASTLMAVIQACQYLRALPPRQNLSPLAVSGGVYLMLNPENSLVFAKGSALAERECRPFDAAADGFILGEGAGIFILKRLEDAVTDGDRIYSVIKGAAWSNDAGTSSPMTPSQAGQARLLRLGFESSQIQPDEVGYVECQGTGAPAGDHTELAALHEVWSGENKPVLGSAKANFGHTLSAAGAAGLLRASMALHTRVLPPQAAWSSWHPKLQDLSDKFRMITDPEPWQGNPVATVSAFGFGGTNGFLVLQSAPLLSPAPPRGPYFLPVSAPSFSLLKEHLRELVETEFSLDELSYTLRLRQAQEFTLLARVMDRAEWERVVEELLGVSENLEETVATDSYLLGATERLQRPEIPGWQTEQEWLQAETVSKNLVPSCSLPPSPLVRSSLWPVERLPGPQS
jgi:acyl transferase domain-containing protein